KGEGFALARPDGAEEAAGAQLRIALAEVLAIGDERRWYAGRLQALLHRFGHTRAGPALERGLDLGLSRLPSGRARRLGRRPPALTGRGQKRGQPRPLLVVEHGDGDPAIVVLPTVRRSARRAAKHAMRHGHALLRAIAARRDVAAGERLERRRTEQGDE